MKKVLIVGSKGFIGSHVFQGLSELVDLYECDIVNDQNSPRYIQIDNLETDIVKIFKEQQFDYCINCSGAASVPHSIMNPLNDYYLNTVNVFRILEGIRHYNSDCKFINLSSAAVYGNPVNLPIREDSSLKPISPYGAHKLMSEQICSEFYEHFQVKNCNLRIFSAFGIGLKKQLFWDLHKKMNDNKEIQLYGTGYESRDFIHVSDVVKIIHLVMQFSSFTAECINVANGFNIQVNEIVRLFSKHYGWEGKVVYTGNSRSGDPIDWRADIKKVEALGYRQSKSIDEGIEEYVGWLKGNRQ